jgi:hypothetical protein
MELRLPLHEITGAQPGPTLGITAGIHGDEYLPLETVRQFVTALNPAQLSGTILAIPVVNPLAIEAQTRNTPIDMNNLNRVFPGDPHGWLTEQLAAVVSEQFLPRLQYLVDLHAGGAQPTVDYVYIQNDEAMSLARLATEACYWPLFEVEGGRYRLDYRPRAKRPIAAWLERQGRFAHLARPEAEHLVAELQHWIDEEWDLLLRKCDEVPEDQWQTTKDRRSSRLSLTPRPIHHTALGEPLTASMTANTIDWGAWGATSSAFSWGVVDD